MYVNDTYISRLLKIMNDNPNIMIWFGPGSTANRLNDLTAVVMENAKKIMIVIGSVICLKWQLRMEHLTTSL